MDQPIVCRRALPSDAMHMSRLYRSEYQAASGTRGGGYPFPQFFNPEWVAKSITGPSFYWVVAVSGERVLATTGVVLNIGRAEDQIAEGFGLVVDSAARGHGVARQLFPFLMASIRERVQFVIGEARTANPGGWHVLRSCQFVPIGFEPFAHQTPAGMESMLLTGWIPDSARHRAPRSFPLSADARQLANEVLAACRSRYGPAENWGPTDASCSPRTTGLNEITDTPRSELVFGRDDELGKQVLVDWPRDAPDSTGVLRLWRLEGAQQAGRFQKQYYVGRAAANVVCSLCVSWDELDRRARILDLRSRDANVLHAVLVALSNDLQQTVGDPLTIVADVRVDVPHCHRAFEALGFRATAYYPNFIASGNGRLDCLQYTFSSSRAFHEGWNNVRNLDWDLALRLATTVMGPADSSNRSNATSP